MTFNSLLKNKTFITYYNGIKICGMVDGDNVTYTIRDNLGICCMAKDKIQNFDSKVKYLFCRFIHRRDSYQKRFQFYNDAMNHIHYKYFNEIKDYNGSL